MDLSAYSKRVASCGLLSFFLVANSHAGVFAHYSFDTDYTDSSGFDRHGTLVDVDTIGNSGIIKDAGASMFGGGSMDFSDDRDYIELPSQTFSSGVPYTIAFWAQKDDAARDWNMVIGQRDNINFFIAPRRSPENIIRWRSSNRTDERRQEDFASVSDTDWHHYAFVSDGTDLSYYFDGVLVGTAVDHLTGFIIDTIGEAYLAANDFDFQGRIDEVWILDEAADAEMIGGLFTQNDPDATGEGVEPRILGIRVEGTTVEIDYEAPKGKVYFLYSSPDMTRWEDEVDDSVAGSGTATDDLALRFPDGIPDRIFYRLIETEG